MPVSEEPARLIIQDLQSEVSIVAMFNPNELTRRVNVNYGRKPVLGNSHLEHEYLQTDNQQIQFDLFFLAESPGDLAVLKDAVNFLESLCYGPEDPDSISQAAPPRCLVLWPRTMSIVARLTSVEFVHQRWNRFGDTTQVTIRTTWEESRVTRLRQTDVRNFGALRPSENQGSE